MPDMIPTSLVADVAPRTGKFIKNGLMCLKEEKICYKMVYYIITPKHKVYLASANCQKSC